MDNAIPIIIRELMQYSAIGAIAVYALIENRTLKNELMQLIKKDIEAFEHLREVIQDCICKK